MNFEQLRAQLKQSAQEQQRQSTQRDKPRRRQRRSALGIANHRVFVPVLAGWGAALGGLSVAILPGSLIASIMMATGLAALGGFARPALAVSVACVCGLAAFLAARAVRRIVTDQPSEHILSKVAARKVHPIDPASELGSESLDAPLGESLAEADAATHEDGEDPSHNWAAHWPLDEPFELDADHAISGEGEVQEAPALAPALDPAEAEPSVADHGADDAADQPAPLQPGSLQRDKVWVIGSEAEVALPQEPAEEPAHESGTLANRHAAAPASGIERLRQARTEDLSLVELVERFAAALHDHQQHARRREAADHTTAECASTEAPARDAALAEALKALAQFTQDDAPGGQSTGQSAGHSGGQSIGRVGETERALRNALARLQDMRGAA